MAWVEVERAKFSPIKIDDVGKAISAIVIREACGYVGQIVEMQVVAGDKFVVTRENDIEFDKIDALGVREGGGSEAVFGGVTTGAAMTDDERIGVHANDV